MAGDVRVRFRGLCTFLDRSSHYDALLLKGGGNAQHGAVMIIRLDHLHLSDTNGPCWRPDLLAHDPDGRAIGIWHIPVPGRVTFSGARPSGNTAQQWTDRREGIDLRAFHQGDMLRLKPDARLAELGAIVQVSGGQLRCERQRDFHLVDPPDPQPRRRTFSSEIVWTLLNDTPVTVTRETGGQGCAFVLEERADVSIANLSASMTSRSHFDAYYSIFEDAPEQVRLRLEPLGALEETIFDCVPPTPGP